MIRVGSAGIALVVLVLVVAGCAAEVPLAKRRYDLSAKHFSRPADDRANIYVFRNGNAMTQVQLFIDGIPAGTLAGYTYALLTVRPGRHTLVSRKWQTDTVIILDIHGGLNYYVEQGGLSKPASPAAVVGAMAAVAAGGPVVGTAVAAGISDATPRTPSYDLELELVDRADGREAVRNCYLIAEVPPPLPPMPKVAPKAEAEDADLPPGW